LFFFAVDPAWNTLDDQAADRVYRMGQTKNVIIYRLITCGTIEEKMYRKQVFKGGLSRTLLGQKQQQFSYFTKGELSELFKFDDPDKAETHDMLQGFVTWTPLRLQVRVFMMFVS
jgi:hypothetical protein